jgi:integrase
MYRRGSAFYLRSWEGGRERRRSLGTDYTKACDLYHKIKGGDDAATAPTTVAAMGERWADVYICTRRDEKGTKEARVRFRRYLGRFAGHMAIDRVRPDHVREYRTWLERQKSKKTGRLFTPCTVKHLLDDARSFFGWLEEGGYVTRSPFPRGLMPKIPEKVPNPYTEGQVEAFLALEEPYSWTIRVGLASWGRWGEVTRLQAKDLQKDGTLIVSQGKTGHVKHVPVEADMATEIRRRVGLLVPFSPTSSGSFNREVTERVGFKFTFHRLRATAGCRALESGMRIEVVSRLLGHRSIETTRHYARLSDQAVRREVERSWASAGD